MHALGRLSHGQQRDRWSAVPLAFWEDTPNRIGKSLTTGLMFEVFATSAIVEPHNYCMLDRSSSVRVSTVPISTLYSPLFVCLYVMKTHFLGGTICFFCFSVSWIEPNPFPNCGRDYLLLVVLLTFSWPINKLKFEHSSNMTIYKKSCRN